MEICYDYLRPRKAELMKQRYALYDSVHESEIIELSEAAVAPAFYTAEGRVNGVVDRDNGFCVLSGSVDSPEAIEDKCRQSTGGCEDSTVAYMGYFNEHWGHFITDCLSSFWILDVLSVDKYVFSFDEDKEVSICDNIREALELLGVWGKIEIVNRVKRYNKVFVASMGMMPRSYILPETKKVYDRIIAAALRKGASLNVRTYDKILMSRAHFSKAKLNDLGTGEVEDMFISNGYKAVSPERLSLSELIYLLHHASDTVAVSGTLMHNMLFAPDGSRLTVIEKYANINNYQQGIDRLKNLRVVYIDAFYLVYSVDPGLGPFILRCTDELARFMADNGMKMTTREQPLRKVLCKYFKLYFRHYKRQWILPDWLEEEIGVLREAYSSSAEVLSPWLQGEKLLFLSDLFKPRLVLKMLLRRMGFY